MHPSRRSLVALRAAAALAALVALGSVSAAHAQDAGDRVPPAPWERRSPVRFAVGGGGIYQSATGTAATRPTDGTGFDVFGSLGVSSLALGVGYQRTQHRAPSADAARVVYQGLFVEPRFSVAPYRNFTPYVNGRVSLLREQVSAGTGSAIERTSVVALGAGIGTLVWLAPSVSLDLGGMYSDMRVGSRSGRVAGSGGRGTGRGVMLRAGVVLGFDRWGR